MELVWWQVRRAPVAPLAFQRPVWTEGSVPLNSLQVQGRCKEQRRKEWRQIEPPHPTPPQQYNGPFLHLYPPQYLAEAFTDPAFSYRPKTAVLCIDSMVGNNGSCISSGKGAGMCAFVGQHFLKRWFAVVYCRPLNEYLMFAKTLKLLEGFPPGGFSSVFYLFL